MSNCCCDMEDEFTEDNDFESADEVMAYLVGFTREETPDFCWAVSNTRDSLGTLAIYQDEREALRIANELNGYVEKGIWLVKRVRYGFDVAEELTDDNV